MTYPDLRRHPVPIWAQFGDVLWRAGWAAEWIGTPRWGIAFVQRGKFNPTGFYFFATLSRTRNLARYLLEDGETLSYPVRLRVLRRAQSLTSRYLFVVWDVKQEAGYWVYLKPFIRDRLAADPAWLENRAWAYYPVRQVHIPLTQKITRDNADSLAAWYRSGGRSE
ncbi:MAG: hypothetical protein PVF47_16580 [Anaerolineae bacterium]|jgi:hypothetical protein